MCNRFRAAALVATLVLIVGCLCGISAQVQTSSSDTTDTTAATSSSNSSPSQGDTPSVTSTSTKPSPSSSSPSEASTPAVTSASTKTGMPSVDSSSSNPHTAHPDLKTASAVQPKDKDKVNDLYVVGVADGLFISVWKEADLSGLVVVRPDGMITVPVVGDVKVAGLTTQQVQNLLTEKLKDVVAEPQVTVIVRDIRSRKAYLVGKVGHAGAVELTSPETVLSLLAEAGGPAPLAKSQKMYILRTENGKQKRIDFNYKKVVKGSQPDVEVMVGDIIVVP